MKTHNRGFTLIEILVVISIISVLVALLLPTLAKSRDLSRTTQCLSNLRQLNLAQFQYADMSQNYVPMRTWNVSSDASTFGLGANRSVAWTKRFEKLGMFENGLVNSGAGKPDHRTCPEIRLGPAVKDLDDEPYATYAMEESLTGHLNGTTQIFPYRRFDNVNGASKVFLLADSPWYTNKSNSQIYTFVRVWVDSGTTFGWRFGANYAAAFPDAGNYPGTNTLISYRHQEMLTNFSFVDGHAASVKVIKPTLKYPFGKISYKDYNPAYNADATP